MRSQRISLPPQLAPAFTNNLASVGQLARKHDHTLTGDNLYLSTMGRPRKLRLRNRTTHRRQREHAYPCLNGEAGDPSWTLRIRNITKVQRPLSVPGTRDGGSAGMYATLIHDSPELLARFEKFYPSVVKAFQNVSQNVPNKGCMSC